SAAGLSSPGRSARARGPSSPRPEERYGLLLTRVRSSGAHEGVIGAGWDRDLLVPGWGVGDDGRAPSYGLGRGGLVWSRRGGGAISELLDRTAETAAVERVLAAVRDGLSGVLVLRGEAGIGKTALVEWAAGQAQDMRLARVAGIQAEMGMGFAGL